MIARHERALIWFTNASIGIYAYTAVRRPADALH